MGSEGRSSKLTQHPAVAVARRGTPWCGSLGGSARCRGMVALFSIERAVKTGSDVEIFRVVRPQKRMPHGEIEDDQIDVEFEV